MGRVIISLSGVDIYTYSKFIAPISEEVFKAIPILMYAGFFKPKKRALLECSLLFGVGFGMLENAYVLALNAENVVLGDIIGRAFGSGMMHGVCTFAIGYGLTFFAFKGKRFRLLTVGLGIFAVLYHSLYNILVLSPYSVIGFIMPVLAFIPLVLVIRKKSGENLSAEKRP